jgi:hypothetical protein
MMRGLLIAGFLLGAIASAGAQTTLRVGDQKGNSQAVMEAAGVLNACEGVPQIMKPETCQIGPFGNQCPRSLEVSTRLIFVGTRDDKVPDARQVF